MNKPATRKKAPRQVVWTEEEADAVARAAYTLMLEPGTALSGLDAVKRAQVSLLSAARRRKFHQARDLDARIRPRWEQYVAADKAAQAAAPAPKNAAKAVTPMVPPLVPADVLPPKATNNWAPSVVADAVSAHIEQQGEPTKKKVKVFWKGDEKWIIARESHRLMAESPRLSRLKAVNQAVLLLPPERQRRLHQEDGLFWLDELWALYEIELRNEKQEAEKQEAELAARREEAAAAHAKYQAAQAAATPTRLEDHSFQALLRAFAAKIGDQLIEMIGEHLQGTVEQRITDVLKNLPLTPATAAAAAAMPEGATRLKLAPREHKPRVTVVGLLNQQERDVSDALGQSIEFVFVKSQGSGGGGGASGGHGMLARSAHSDVVIAMTQFIGHDVEKAARHLNVPLVRINGSVSALKRWLMQWLNGEIALAAA